MSLTMNNNNYWMVVNAEGSDGVPVKVDFLNLKKGALILRALNHKLRQQIIRLHGGQLVLEAPPGGGTAAVVLLPIGLRAAAPDIVQPISIGAPIEL